MTAHALYVPKLVYFFWEKQSTQASIYNSQKEEKKEVSIYKQERFFIFYFFYF